MISVRELRLRNWVYSYDDKKPWQVTWLEDDGTEIEPIPLTDELFEKSGFELFESGKKYWCHGSYMFVKGEKGFDVIHDYNWDEIAEPIEYVHQLQNMIFALTGKEINIEI